MISEYGSSRCREKKEPFRNYVGLHGNASCGVIESAGNDDALIMKAIREITGRGNDAEVRMRGNGKLVVYEVKKSISIG